ncbi:unnamed protein product [Cylindrotheca closterium]|uniref:RING-type domain-containing protein n=1 Tax=Cylindrotheca closterium TaxID=2856 RepID=A0AAD2G0H6_9STRA|nr:unnamed protein product [Cylindrotheca closterium]
MAADLRLLIPGAIFFCYVTYLSISLFRSNCKRRVTLREQQRVRERVLQRLEQERREEAQRDREELQEKLEIDKTLRMEQIMNALEFEVLADSQEKQTSSYSESNYGAADDADAAAGGTKSQRHQEDEVNADGNTLSAQIRSSERKGNNPECVICLQSYNAGQVLCSASTSKCHHIFHEECAIEWLQESNECPLCRVDLLATGQLSV